MFRSIPHNQCDLTSPLPCRLCKILNCVHGSQLIICRAKNQNRPHILEPSHQQFFSWWHFRRGTHPTGLAQGDEAGIIKDHRQLMPYPKSGFLWPNAVASLSQNRVEHATLGWAKVTVTQNKIAPHIVQKILQTHKYLLSIDNNSGKLGEGNQSESTYYHRLLKCKPVLHSLLFKLRRKQWIQNTGCSFGPQWNNNAWFLWFPHNRAAQKFHPNFAHKIGRTWVINLASDTCSYCLKLFLHRSAIYC